MTNNSDYCLQLMQEWLDNPTGEDRLSSSLQNIGVLFQNFVNTAVPIAKRIINDLLYSVDKRTHSRAAQIGGLAGGEKFISENILFKLAIDRYTIYGGDEFAKKAARI